MIGKSKNRQEWNDFVDNNFECPYYSQYFEWAIILEKTFKNLRAYPLTIRSGEKLKDIILLIYDKDSKIIYSPSPFGGLGGFQNQESYFFLINHIYDIFPKEARHIQISSIGESKFMKILRPGVLMQINLLEANKEIDNIPHKRVMRNIKSSKKMGTMVRVEQFNLEKIDWVYSLYLEAMEKNNAKFIFPLEIFLNIIEIFKDRTVFFECFLPNGQLIGYNLAFISKNKITSWFTIIDYKYKGYNPASLLYYEMMLYGKQNNINIIDYGPTAIGSDNYEFKRRLGAKNNYYNNYIYPLNLIGKLFYFKNRVITLIKR